MKDDLTQAKKCGCVFHVRGPYVMVDACKRHSKPWLWKMK